MPRVCSSTRGIFESPWIPLRIPGASGQDTTLRRLICCYGWLKLRSILKHTLSQGTYISRKMSRAWIVILKVRSIPFCVSLSMSSSWSTFEFTDSASDVCCQDRVSCDGSRCTQIHGRGAKNNLTALSKYPFETFKIRILRGCCTVREYKRQKLQYILNLRYDMT